MVDFLDVDDVILIHEDQVKSYGGLEGVRDKDLLMSAVAQPKMRYQGKYLHKSLFDMGAAYLFHITRNHPFIDGNKRTGIATALVFLDINNIKFDAPDNELEVFVQEVAKGSNSKKAISNWLAKFS